MMSVSMMLYPNRAATAEPAIKNIIELPKPTNVALLIVFTSFEGCMSSPRRNRRKMMPNLEMLLINSGLSMNANPDGPRIIPVNM